MLSTDNLRVGDQVFSDRYGYGSIVKIREDLKYPIVVSFSLNGSTAYTKDGVSVMEDQLYLKANYKELKETLRIDQERLKEAEKTYLNKELFENVTLKQLISLNVCPDTLGYDLSLMDITDCEKENCLSCWVNAIEKGINK